MSISTIRRWIVTFKDGEEEIKDKARSGRPREAVTSEKIARVEDLVSDDPHISTIELVMKSVFFDKVENLARAVQAVAETISKADYKKSLQG